jgi:hypothetical protein
MQYIHTTSLFIDRHKTILHEYPTSMCEPYTSEILKNLKKSDTNLCNTSSQFYQFLSFPRKHILSYFTQGRTDNGTNSTINSMFNNIQVSKAFYATQNIH